MFATERAWVRAFWDAIRPYARDSGSYVNFIAEADDERVRLEERIGILRGLIETLDLLFDAFGKVRTHSAPQTRNFPALPRSIDAGV